MAEEPAAPAAAAAPRKPRNPAAREIAIRAIGRGLSVRAAARHARVNESSIRGWLKQPNFIAAVEALQDEQIKRAERILRGSAARAARSLVEVASGKIEGSAQQVAAARDILERLHVGKAQRVQAVDPLETMSDDELAAEIQKQQRIGR